MDGCGVDGLAFGELVSGVVSSWAGNVAWKLTTWWLLLWCGRFFCVDVLASSVNYADVRAR